MEKSIPQYYVRSVGDSVNITCGVKQGPLASLYVAKWVHIREGVLNNVETILRERVEVKREKLQDFSLAISSLELTDSGKYQCVVTIAPEKGNSPLQSSIELLVHREFYFNNYYFNLCRVYIQQLFLGKSYVMVKWYTVGNRIRQQI